MEKALKEIHEIREKIYEKEKDMNMKETIGRLHERIEKIMKERNLKLKIKEKDLLNV